jgi:recombination protein RecT
MAKREISQAEANAKTAPRARFTHLLQEQLSTIQRVAHKKADPDRLLGLALVAGASNPTIYLCSARSVIQSMLICSELDLNPGVLGHVYLVPFKKRDSHELTVIIGAQGYLELMYRSGLVTAVDFDVVRKGDEFSYRRGLRPELHHVAGPSVANEDITHAWACAELKSGGSVFVVLTIEEIERRRNFSRARDGFGWKDHYAAMCMKTALRALAKRCPKSAELRQAEAVEAYSETGQARDLGEVLDLPMMEDENEAAPELGSESLKNRLGVDDGGEQPALTDGGGE